MRKGKGKGDSLKNSTQDIEATLPGESSHQPRGRVHQFVEKIKGGVNKLRVSRSKDSTSRSPAPLNINHERTPSTPVMNQMDSLPELAITMAFRLKDARDGLDTFDKFQDTYVNPFRIFNDFVGWIADVHPYAKIALGVLSGAAKIILAQVDRDTAILKLFDKLWEVYSFIIQDEMIRKISSMHATLAKISVQTQECADFIKNYLETKNFWKRLSKNVFSETEDTIKKYNDVFDTLMQNFRDQVICDVAIHVHYTEETMQLDGMTYAKCAGLDTRKQCLQGTRREILSEIQEWVTSTEDDVKRVLWLSGPAGKGKSFIAHTIAKWFEDKAGLGSCYTFDRQREDRRLEKIFSTIARDLADRDPEMRRALADVVRAPSSLKTTADILQQWQKLLIDPLKKSSRSTGEPIVIVIDALDESGGVETRRDLLLILAGKHPNPAVPKITDLPKNFRFIVTSRSLDDINDEFSGVQHIRSMSMDHILPAVAERDIHAYVSKELQGRGFHDNQLAMLAANADGLFEWARLACEYIRRPYLGSSPMECFDEVVNRPPRERKNLLYDMCRLILKEIMPKDKGAHYDRAVAKFGSVMGQILATSEPLPLVSLQAMRDHFPEDDSHYSVDAVIKHMGSLLSGATDSYTPIRPLHTSFRDFLMDESSNGEFFIDLSKAQRDLAFASLRVMEHGLRFDICNLKSSYLPNNEDPGLQERVQQCIPPHLSYSSRFWMSHVRTAVFNKELAKEVTLFFDHERLFFWLELLALVNALGGAGAALPLISQWLKDHSDFEEVASTAVDVQRFIQVFGGIILHSTPHLYVSALPFTPANSPLSRIFSAQFPSTLRVASGRDINWPAIQAVLRGHTKSVNSVSFSRDGIRIVTGSSDWTVRLWDAATGQPVGEPLRGHTGPVNSVSFSPDGTRIVSGSQDKTVRLWDAATGQPVGEPLCGHTGSVNSVSFSPDGTGTRIVTRIVTGSQDNTVRLWDAATRQPVGEPFRGHTDSVNSVSFSPDGTLIVTGSSDQTVRLWNAATGQPVGTPFRGHTGSVSSVSFSPDGTCIVTGSKDETVRLWHTATGQPVCKPSEKLNSVNSVSFSPDGTRIVGSDSCNVWQLHGATGEEAGRYLPLLGRNSSSVNSVSFSPDSTRIVIGSEDNIATVWLWNAATEKPVSEPLRGYTSCFSSVSFSPDGTRIVTGSWDTTVRLWDAATGQPVGEPFRGHASIVQSVSFSPDGTHIVSSSGRTVRLWDAVTGQPVGEPLRGHTGSVNSVSFSPNGTRIVTGSWDKTVRLWDAATGQPVGEPLRGHTDSVNSVSFSRDGTRIVTGSKDQTVRLWDAATGQSVGEPFLGHTNSVWSASFSPDGTRIVTGSSDWTVRLWDVAMRKPVGEPLRGCWVSFSPDGTRIASVLRDNTVQLWDVATRQPVGEPFRGHTGLVHSVSFSPDGTRIVTSSRDCTVRLWDAVTRQPSQQYVESHPSDERRTIETTTPRKSNTWNNHFIRFSSDPTHALCDTSELKEGASHDDRSSTHFLLDRDSGWMVGPKRRLLFWVPLASRKPFYSPETALVMPRGCPELDLSRMAHGQHWQKCREEP